MLLWNTEVWNSTQLITGEHFLGVVGDWKRRLKKYLLLNVYGPQLTSKKCALWSELKALINNFHGAVCVMGDFNIVSVTVIFRAT